MRCSRCRRSQLGGSDWPTRSPGPSPSARSLEYGGRPPVNTLGGIMDALDPALLANAKMFFPFTGSSTLGTSDSDAGGPLTSCVSRCPNLSNRRCDLGCVNRGAFPFGEDPIRAARKPSRTRPARIRLNDAVCPHVGATGRVVAKVGDAVAQCSGSRDELAVLRVATWEVIDAQDDRLTVQGRVWSVGGAHLLRTVCGRSPDAAGHAYTGASPREGRPMRRGAVDPPVRFRAGLLRRRRSASSRRSG
jgi:hypothetical protein